MIDQHEASGILRQEHCIGAGLWRILSINLNAPGREMMILYRLEISTITSK